MAKKNDEPVSAFDPEAVVFDLSRMRARDMSVVSRGSKSWDEWAAVFSQNAVSAPGLVGDVSSCDSWLDLLKGDFEKTVQAFMAELSGKN
jgi:hypothetical protein